MLGVTTFGIIAGAVIGLPLLLFARIGGGTMPVELIAPTVGWWFVLLVLAGLIGRLALGRPTPTYGSFWLARHWLR